MAAVLFPKHFEDLSSASPSSPLQFVNDKLPVTEATVNVNCEGFHDRRLEPGNKAQFSILSLLIAALRRVSLACQQTYESFPEMEIGWPTDVRHVAHITFDQASGFVGLNDDEFETAVPTKPPSAGASVFGVSPESMQCSVDTKGNSIPLILLLLQKKLYHDGGLKAEGIFRINAENGQEKDLRDLLNKGIVPQDIDVHCLAGLIKAWFGELPVGVFDILSPAQVLQCHTEEQCFELVKLLPPTQAALLDWAVNLMADVVQEQEFNKMNARNIAMVFAPNMTQMSDPVTALMHAVQVMNFLKTMVLKTLRDREAATVVSNSWCAESFSGVKHESVMNIFMPASNESSRTKDEQMGDSKARASNDRYTVGRTFQFLL